MVQPIPGVTPGSENEATVRVTWPSLASTGYGRAWGRLYENKAGLRLLGIPVTVGRVMALVSIPFILPLYFHTLVPKVPFVVFGWTNKACLRYRLTNRRVVIEHPFGEGERLSVALDRFDSIEVERLPGQAWYRAADLVFLSGEVETFRLAGVPNPEPFRQTCLKARTALIGVRRALQGNAAE